jgi:hypothetical protein
MFDDMFWKTRPGDFGDGLLCRSAVIGQYLHFSDTLSLPLTPRTSLRERTSPAPTNNTIVTQPPFLKKGQTFLSINIHHRQRLKVYVLTTKIYPQRHYAYSVIQEIIHRPTIQ